jgi:mannose/fructose/N-acetylgalactosamine-specific phosphotransferase system component IIB
VIVLTRIDSRLIHGQVVEAWLPHLEVRRVVIADDATAEDALAQVAYRLAVPADVEVVTTPVTGVDYRVLSQDRVRTLVLFRDVQAAVAARLAGLPDGVLNVGNLHSGPGRVEVTRSVFLNDDDKQALQALGAGGMKVVVQAIPAEKPSALPA